MCSLAHWVAEMNRSMLSCFSMMTLGEDPSGSEWSEVRGGGQKFPPAPRGGNSTLVADVFSSAFFIKTENAMNECS